MYNIAYVIVTRNRELIIKDHVSKVYEYYSKNNIGIFIIDGSDNNNLKIYFENNYTNNSVINYYYKPELSFTERIYFGLLRVNAKYICITGDSQIPIVSKIPILNKYINLNYDLIVFSCRDKKHIVYQEYDDIIEMFKDNCWDMTLFGTVYFKRESFSIIEEKFLEKYKNNFFPQIALYFDYYNDKNKFKGIYKKETILYISKYKVGNYWQNNMLYTFGKQWVEIINGLDSKYNNYKSQVILDHGIYSGLRLNNIYGFINWRSTDNLNKKQFILYKDYLSKISKVKIWKIRVIAYSPKWICCLIIIIMRKINKIIMKVRKIYENKKFYN